MARCGLSIDCDVGPITMALRQLADVDERDPEAVDCFLAQFETPAPLMQVKQLRPGVLCAMPSYEFGEFLARHGQYRG